MDNKRKFTSNKRWYDKDQKMAKVLDIIKSLNTEEQKEFTVSLFQLASMVRKSKSENCLDSDDNRSIGKSKVLGFYKSFNKRRWYDDDLSLMGAMNSLSTLSIKECRDIAEGILDTISIS